MEKNNHNKERATEAVDSEKREIPQDGKGTKQGVGLPGGPQGLASWREASKHSKGLLLPVWHRISTAVPSQVDWAGLNNEHPVMPTMPRRLASPSLNSNQHKLH